ncbi:MAG: MinD/ParA family protein [Thermodesulfobacteria bacterium]|nr:MinD/ParA family protein [Thermodesulfobacteriota bacterium]
MRSLAIASGKGGVGKTSFVINLALALVQANKRVLIFDADLGLANVDVMLGISPKFDIRYVLNGELSLKDIIYNTEYKFDIIPAGSGVSELTQLSPEQKLLLKAQMEEAFKNYDFLLFDSSAGISDNVLFFMVLAGERIVICTPEPTSIADAYALIKVAHKKHNLKDFYLVVNMINNEAEGKRIYQQLMYVLERFLPDIKLSYLGGLVYDECVKKAVKSQIPYLSLCSEHPISARVREISYKLLRYKSKDSEGLEEFLERLINF